MKGEEACARAVYDLLCHSRYPSLQETFDLVQDGNMTHIPWIAAEDVKRAFNILVSQWGA
jgi:hypothetical protein